MAALTLSTTAAPVDRCGASASRGRVVATSASHTTPARSLGAPRAIGRCDAARAGRADASHRRPVRRMRAAESVPATTGLSDERKKELAREFVETGSGYFTPVREDLFADDFVFRGPIIGPLIKKDYFATLGTFKLYEAFSDLKSNSWGYSIDPEEPNRVWFFVRQSGVNTGQLSLGMGINVPPSGKKVVGAPEAHSILLNDEGKVRLLTVGYVCDYDAPNSNAENNGAAIGLFYGIGLKLPLGKVFSALQAASSPLKSVAGVSVPQSVSKWEEVPQWYKDYVPARREGTEGAAGF